jgi:hypothetical protein
VLEFWVITVSAIGAIATQDNLSAPQSKASTLALASCVADCIASKQSPPDAFALQERNTVFLRASRSQENSSVWETFLLKTNPTCSL